MAKKKSKKPNIAVEPANGRRRYLELGGWLAVVVVAIIAGAVAFFIVRSRSDGSSTTSSNGSSGALDIPSPAAAEPASRSSAADVLANKTLDVMTADERDLVKTEVARAFDSAAFRATSSTVPAIDVYRIDGRTRVSRQFKDAELPDGHATMQRLVFYCDAADGNLDAFGYTIIPGNVSSAGTTLKAHSQPFDGLISGLDWSQAKDLGFRTMAGHRTHGFEMPYLPPTTGTTVDSKTWFDVDSARIIEREQEGAATYTFDWSVPAPVEIPAGQPVASCASVFYDAVPLARPPEATPPTPVASATGAP